MEKETGKVALRKKATPFFEKNFHFLFVSLCYRSSRHLVSSGSVKNIWKNSFLFYNFVKHSWSYGLSLICEFKSGLLFYSLLGLRFLSSGFFFFAAAVFHNINAPHRGVCVCVCVWVGEGEGGGAWTNNNYQVLNNNLNAKKMQYCLKLHFIMSRWSLQCLESS